MKFFVLQNPKAERRDAVTDYVPADGSRTGEAPRCPVCGKFLGMLPLLPPVRVELEAWGPRWGDVAFGPSDQLLVSDKLKKLFTEAGLAGFVRFDPVEIVKAKRRKPGAGDPPDYWLASIQRSRAALDESASGLVRDEAPTCEECRIGGIIKRVSRIVLRANTWSGEDVFFARGLPGTVLVSERFKRLCEDNDLTNCSLVAAEDFSFDHYPQERPAAGRH
jgi:Immunity protein family (Imm11)